MIKFIKNLFGKKENSDDVQTITEKNIVGIEKNKKEHHEPLKANVPGVPNIGTNEINTGALNVGSNSGSTFISTVNGHLEFRDHPDNQGVFVKTKAATPTVYNDLTNKAYVDALASGYSIQASCVSSTIGTNLDLNSNVENGDNLDQKIIFEGELILVKDQTDSTQNGVYIVDWQGMPIRYPAQNMLENSLFYVEQGVQNRETFWKVTGLFTGPNGQPNYGVDQISFSQVTLHPGGAPGSITLNGTSPINITNPSAGTYGISLGSSGVTPGTYNTVSVNSSGIIIFGTNAPVTGTGTVTSINLSGSNGISIAGSPITNAGTINLSLGDISPTSLTTGSISGGNGTFSGNINITGTINAANLSGTNTGNQTITLTGAVSGSGTSNILTSLSATGVVPGTYQGLTINSAGQITGATNENYGFGTVTNIATGTGLTGGPITNTGTISMGTSGVTTGVYGNGTAIPQITVDALGRIISATTVPVTPHFTWNQITGTVQTTMSNNGYIALNPALTNFALPTNAQPGDIVAFAGANNGGWKIIQNPGQTIHFGYMNTTTGTTGFIASTYKYDYIELLCIVPNTDFIVKASVGNIAVN